MDPVQGDDLGDEGGQGGKEDNEAPRDIEDSGGEDNVPPACSPIVIDAQQPASHMPPLHAPTPHTLGRTPVASGFKPPLHSLCCASPRAVPLQVLTWPPPAAQGSLPDPQSRHIPEEELWPTVFSMPLSLDTSTRQQFPQSACHIVGAP